ncbi:outer membrane lipoprotein-sorting protein [Aquabacterium sp. A7-Y]|uniref:outer membrane lipoprotein-sorting protein n=1 Tax=Aquabacterium sp. A7-Y TaxID=1349605 RepID=UPI00223D397E|nr:outer membrane lipoprotein-sorting protein [Aquabacterium sp. A7-Y]MCW7536894.1 outer membrane lipoprotein-sorting protein [Aquabacterium sp. A7-Y]
MSRPKVCLTSLLLLIAAEAPATAATPEERGYQIAVEADRRNSGWADMTAQLTMTLKNAAGEESRRSMRLKMLEVTGEGDKSVAVFDEPVDVRGSALLSHAHTVRPDDQWLYFPAMKRVKRIASTNKSGPFMGSEFAYEDMSAWELDKFKYRMVGEDRIDGMEVYVLELLPQYEYSGYTKLVTHLDKQHYRPVKVDYFDRKGALLKTQTYAGYKQYRDKFWRASEMTMTNHQTRKQTVLTWSNYAFGTGVPARDFDKEALERLH